MHKNDKNEVQRLAEEIRRYLKNHPNAADTSEGIAIWWLTRQRYADGINLINKALEYLVAEGQVLKSSTTGGRPIYSSVKGNLHIEK